VTLKGHYALFFSAVVNLLGSCGRQIRRLGVGRVNDDDIYSAKKPGYQKGYKPINAGCKTTGKSLVNDV